MTAYHNRLNAAEFVSPLITCESVHCSRHWQSCWLPRSTVTAWHASRQRVSATLYIHTASTV